MMAAAMKPPVLTLIRMTIIFATPVVSILMTVIFVAVYVLFGAMIFQMLTYDDTIFAADHTAMLNMMGTMLAMMAMAFVMSGLAIAVAVIQYMALYDLYQSCEPKNSVLYLVLSIFFNITLPIFVFLCRNKDEGMPPRKTDPEFISQPEEIPLEDYFEE